MIWNVQINVLIEYIEITDNVYMLIKLNIVNKITNIIYLQIFHHNVLLLVNIIILIKWREKYV